MKVIGIIFIIVSILFFISAGDDLIKYCKYGKVNFTDQQKKDLKSNSTIAIVCFLSGLGFLINPFTQVIVCIGLFIFCINGFVNSVEREKQNKIQKEFEAKREEERKQKEKEERARMRREIIQFAKNHDVYLQTIYEDRDRYFNQAVRNLFVSTMTKPSVPNYQRGVVEGSLADNIAIMANAQKKADYEKAMERNVKTAQLARTEFSEYYRCAESIINQLKEIPNSERYVEYEEKEYQKTLEQIRDLRV